MSWTSQFGLMPSLWSHGPLGGVCLALRSQAVTLFVWSVVLWVMVIFTVVAMCVGAVFATCCEDGADVFLQP